jgi:hypothetical protein
MIWTSCEVASIIQTMKGPVEQPALSTEFVESIEGRKESAAV